MTMQPVTSGRGTTAKRKVKSHDSAVVQRLAKMRAKYWQDLDYLVQEFTAIQERLVSQQDETSDEEEAEHAQRTLARTRYFLANVGGTMERLKGVHAKGARAYDLHQLKLLEQHITDNILPVKERLLAQMAFAEAEIAEDEEEDGMAADRVEFDQEESELSSPGAAGFEMTAYDDHDLELHQGDVEMDTTADEDLAMAEALQAGCEEGAINDADADAAAAADATEEANDISDLFEPLDFLEVGNEDALTMDCSASATSSSGGGDADSLATTPHTCTTAGYSDVEDDGLAAFGEMIMAGAGDADCDFVNMPLLQGVMQDSESPETAESPENIHESPHESAAAADEVPQSVVAEVPQSHTVLLPQSVPASLEQPTGMFLGKRGCSWEADGQAAPGAMRVRKRSRGSLVPMLTKEREVRYECSLCKEHYTATMTCNPWWSLVRHMCPRCSHQQVPRIDISLPVNSVDHHAQVLSACADDSDAEGDTDDGEDSEDEEEDDLGEGPQLEAGQAAKLLVLMGHARDCPGQHADPRHAEVCRSTKFLMLHIRDCNGFAPPSGIAGERRQPCAHPWCKPCRNLLYHLVKCPAPSGCAICNPLDLPEPLKQLRVLNESIRCAVRCGSAQPTVAAAAAAAAQEHSAACLHQHHLDHYAASQLQQQQALAYQQASYAHTYAPPAPPQDAAVGQQQQQQQLVKQELELELQQQQWTLAPSCGQAATLGEPTATAPAPASAGY